MMKQFVKALDKNNASFEYLCKKIPRLSDAKINGVFDGPQIRSLMADEKFDATMNQMLGWRSEMLSTIFQEIINIPTIKITLQTYWISIENWGVI